MTETELLEKSKTDEMAVETLLNLYKPLVSKIARRFEFVGGELDDLVQEGMIGLYSAIKSFDNTKDASFKTFATLCITRKMQSAIRHQNT
ncbi:MAG: sigma-70 family RNA polymerase sigma factor, partial [Clostridia bacterium]|nr:sigma-70 family RNA polymerase sigma factor [Clostridia bacterium]